MPGGQQGTDLPNIRIFSGNPNAGLGTPGTPNQLLIRTDTNELYYYKGPLDTSWNLLTGGGGSGPWLPIEPTQTPLVFGWIQTVIADRLNPIATTNGGGTAVFPSAGSVLNGTPIVIKLLDYSGSITLEPDGTDTIDGFSAGDGALASYLDANLASVLAVSNGIDGWLIIRDSTGL